MEPRTLQYIAAACDGTLHAASPETVVTRVSSDSRQIAPGDLFVALTGEKFDGHEFLGEVFSKGAAAAIVDRDRLTDIPSGRPYISASSARVALGRVAATYRQEFKLQSIAVAGSNGKTTTKELVAAVLRQKLHTVWSQASFNNDIGVPLTLLQIEKGHQAGVFEVGTNHPGELLPLAQMVQPATSVLTCIGREHLEFFGDLDGVAREEGAVAEVLPSSGTLILNGDEPHSDAVASRCAGTVVRVGRENINDWQIGTAQATAEGTRFQIQAPDADYSGEYRIQLLGMHQVVNATYAIVVGRNLGLGRAEIQRGLDSCRGAKMRLQPRRFDDFTLLDDSYNANADSVNVALDTLQSFPCRGRRIAVLGAMAELGPTAESAHREVGQHAAIARVDCLFAIGKGAQWTAEAARANGLKEVFELDHLESANDQLSRYIQPGDVVLVKASRSCGFERLVEFLKNRYGEHSSHNTAGRN